MIENLSYCIANHVFTISGKGMASEMEKLNGFGVFQTDKPAEWSVEFGCDLPNRDFKVLNSFSFEDLKDLNCYFGCLDDTYVCTMKWTGSQDEIFRMEYSGGNVIKATTIIESSRLRFILWLAFNLFSVPLGIMAIHSSTIVCKGKANLFLGESGTGKSTHTRLWLNNIEGSRLLNDDSQGSGVWLSVERKNSLLS